MLYKVRESVKNMVLKSIFHKKFTQSLTFITEESP